MVDATPPILNVTEVDRVTNPWVDLQGTCSDLNGVTVAIDGDDVELKEDGSFARRVAFDEPGARTLRIVSPPTHEPMGPRAGGDER